MSNKTFPQLIRRPEVIQLSGRSKSSLHLDEKAGLMPPPISIGERAVAYIRHEIEAVITARVEGKSKSQIQELVKSLINSRSPDL